MHFEPILRRQHWIDEVFEKSLMLFPQQMMNSRWINKTTECLPSSTNGKYKTKYYVYVSFPRHGQTHTRNIYSLTCAQCIASRPTDRAIQSTVVVRTHTRHFHSLITHRIQNHERIKERQRNIRDRSANTTSKIVEFLIPRFFVSVFLCLGASSCDTIVIMIMLR